MKFTRALGLLLLLALTSCATGEYREGHFEKSFRVSGKV